MMKNSLKKERRDAKWTLEPISFMYQEHKIVQLYKVTKGKKIPAAFILTSQYAQLK